MLLLLLLKLIIIEPDVNVILLKLIIIKPDVIVIIIEPKYY